MHLLGSLIKITSCTMFLFVLVSECKDLICHKGQYTDGNVCHECPGDTYMPEDNHTNTKCYPCTIVTVAYSEVIKECSTEVDTIIHCLTGFFKSGSMCHKCSVCDPGHEIKACSTTSDTVCCNSEDYYVHITNNGSKMCKKKKMVCKENTFYNQSARLCVACPPGTYKSENDHDDTACNPCQQQWERNGTCDSYIASACNLTCTNTSEHVSGGEDGGLNTVCCNHSDICKGNQDINYQPTQDNETAWAVSSAVSYVVPDMLMAVGALLLTLVITAIRSRLNIFKAILESKNKPLCCLFFFTLLFHVVFLIIAVCLLSGIGHLSLMYIFYTVFKIGAFVCLFIYIVTTSIHFQEQNCKEGEQMEKKQLCDTF